MDLKSLAILCSMGVCGVSAHADVIITELMQSNIDCITDDLNEFPDSWVELYNNGTADENLKDYSINVKDKPDKAYALPDHELKAGQYCIIYCDKAGTGMHADFRLESGKDGAVYLYRSGQVADKVEGMKKQPAPNIAYGRLNSDSDQWGYQDVPTPGKENCGRLCKDVLDAPVFSHAGCVANKPVELTLSLYGDAPADARIVYTTDGTEPTAESPAYVSPIVIDKTTTVRAKVIADGYLSPRSTTHSYIFHPRTMSLPVVSIVTDKKYFYDPKMGIYVEGLNINDPNYKHNWRRPANIEYFAEPDKDSEINQLIELRVKGGATRDLPLKSLALYANKRFGEKRFNYEFFPEHAPGLDEWKSVELRNSGNDFDYLYFRDAVIQRMMGVYCDLDWQPWQPTIFYLNGKYMGLLNLRPRSNEDYVYTFYDGEEDIDVIENWWEVKEGSAANMDAFKAFYNEHGHTYDEYDKWMDVSEFCNLMIMNLVFDNKDFPANNIECWRPTAEGGRWRWIVKDTDFGLGLYGGKPEYKTINWINDNNFDWNNTWGNTWDGTRLFRRLMEDKTFKDMFADRVAVYLGDFLKVSVVHETLEATRRVIDGEYPSHCALYNRWRPNYDDEMGFVKWWYEVRHDFFPQHLAEYYKLGDAVALTIDKGRSDDVRLSVNGIKMSTREFDGHYYAGRQLVITAESGDDAEAVTGWTVKQISSASTIVDEVNEPELKINLKKNVKYEISSRMGSSALGDIDADNSGFDTDAPCEVHDMSGRSLGRFSSWSAACDHLAPGAYIVRQGSLAVKRAI